MVPNWELFPRLIGVPGFRDGRRWSRSCFCYLFPGNATVAGIVQQNSIVGGSLPETILETRRGFAAPCDGA